MRLDPALLRHAIGNRGPRAPFDFREAGAIPLPGAAWSSIPGRAAMGDLTGRGRDLTVVGTAPTKRASKFGVPVFESPDISTDYWSASQLPQVTQYSYLMLVKFDAVPGAADASQFRSSSTNNSYGFNYDHGSGSFRQSIHHRDSGGTFFPITYTTSLQADTWYWIGATWDGATVRAYLQGKEEGSSSVGSIMTTSGAMQMAANAGVSVTAAWTVLSLMWWPTALTARQMWALYDPQTRWDFYRARSISRIWPATGGAVTHTLSVSPGISLQQSTNRITAVTRSRTVSLSPSTTASSGLSVSTALNIVTKPLVNLTVFKQVSQLLGFSGSLGKAVFKTVTAGLGFIGQSIIPRFQAIMRFSWSVATSLTQVERPPGFSGHGGLGSGGGRWKRRVSTWRRRR